MLWQELALGLGRAPSMRDAKPGAAQGGVSQHRRLGSPLPQQQQPWQADHEPAASGLLRVWHALDHDQRLAALQAPNVLDGSAAWRPGQCEPAVAVLDALATQRHALLVMPCGSGKSWVLQGAATAARLCCLVVTPTVASRSQWLLSDATGRGAVTADTAAAVAHHRNRIGLRDWARLARRLSNTEGLLVVGTPEDVTSSDVATALRSAVGTAFAMAAVDEAHLWLSWPAFRPKMTNALAVIAGMGVPVVALTGTLPPPMVPELCHALGLDDDGRLVDTTRQQCTRTDVVVRVQVLANMDQRRGAWLAAACGHMGVGGGGDSGGQGPKRVAVVYVPTIAAVAHVRAELGQHGIVANAYHGRMAEEDKRAAVHGWTAPGGQCCVMVATVALSVAVHHDGVVLVVDIGDAEAAAGDTMEWAQKVGRLARGVRDGSQPHVSGTWREEGEPDGERGSESWSATAWCA